MWATEKRIASLLSLGSPSVGGHISLSFDCEAGGYDLNTFPWNKLHLKLYFPPTNLREGNVFSHVCPSFCSQEGSLWPLPMMHWTSLYRSPGPSLGPKALPHETSLERNPIQPQSPLGMGPHWTGTPCKWYMVAITLDLFKLVHLSTSPTVLTSGGYWSAYGRHTQAVCILLEYFLVFKIHWCLCGTGVSGKENIRLCENLNCFKENNKRLIRSLLCHIRY